MKVDNFALTNFQTCPAKYELRIKQGWTTRRRSSALSFGGGFHEGLAVWYKTHDLAAALSAIVNKWDDSVSVDDYRTKEKAVQVMIDYVKHYPQESFKVVGFETGAPMIEVPFVLDTGLHLDCQLCAEHPGVSTPFTEARTKVITKDICSRCGTPYEPIEYGGIFDGLVDFNGQLWVFEHKTTSQLGSYYFDQFKPNNQVTGYIWAAEQLSGRKVQGAIINAIGVYKTGATKFERGMTARHPQDLKEWLENIRIVCNQIKRAEKEGYSQSTGACTLYGKCEYHSIHVLSHPSERQKRLESDYIQEAWDFEHRTGTEVKDG